MPIRFSSKIVSEVPGLHHEKWSRDFCFPSIFFGANASIEMDLVLVRLHKTYILAIFFFHLLVEPLIFVSSRVGGRSWNNSAVRPVNWSDGARLSGVQWRNRILTRVRFASPQAKVAVLLVGTF